MTSVRFTRLALIAALLGGILACGGGGSHAPSASNGGPPTSAPVFTTHPSNQTITAGRSVAFCVAASGNPTPTYAWERSADGNAWAAIGGATDATCSFTAAKSDDRAQFRAKATNSLNTVTSGAATLSVQWLEITAQPGGQAVTSPAPATFTLTVDANPAPTYQWQSSPDGTHWADLPGATGSQYATAPTSTHDSGTRFRCLATNAALTLPSDAATLTVNAPLAAPVFTTQPASLTVKAGNLVAFTVAASGNPSPTFTWERSSDGSTWTPIDGAGSATYAFLAQLADNAALFRAQASNSVDTATSSAATLTVNTVNNQTWSSLAAGSIHSAAVKSNGTLWAWGSNFHGQLGDGTNQDKLRPIQIGTGSQWGEVRCGGMHTLAIKADGTLWAWGYNNFGQLGIGNNSDQNTPIQIGTDHDWSSVAAGCDDSMAIKKDGTLWAWGSNTFGQVGNGTYVSQNSPIQIGTTALWSSVASGFWHTLAIQKDGSLWAWGDNDDWQLGDGTKTSRTSPVHIGGLYSSVSAGEHHSLAIDGHPNGHIWAWGGGAEGQLGLGETFDSRAPAMIGSDNRWSTVVAGENFTAALKSDGTLWAWGFNAYGQVGDGTNVNRTAPVQIGSDTNWIAAAPGGCHTLGLRADGTLWAWGYNGAGQLGDGSLVNKNTPIQVDAIAPITLQIPDISHPGSLVPLVMLPIPAGTFTMGSPDPEQDRGIDESPQHSVSLDAFYMANQECTQAQWLAVMGGTNPSFFSVAGTGATSDDLTRPVEQVSYEDITSTATGFLDKLNAFTAALRPAGLVFRLPTEAEWEYAARAGTTTRFFWGEDPLCTAASDHAWWDVNSDGKTHPVATKPPNPWGLFDMIGNVWEWCEDRYGAYSSTEQTNPSGPPDGPLRINRGGGWCFYGGRDPRAALRGADYPNIRSSGYGFRVVLAAPLTH